MTSTDFVAVTLGDNATDWLQDGTAVTSNQWGSPMSEAA